MNAAVQSPAAKAVHKIGLCVKPDSEAAGRAAAALHRWLQQRGAHVRVDPQAAKHCEAPAAERRELAGWAQLLLVLGGDGTLLSVARQAGAQATPILGINLGSLGFLAEVNPEEQFPVLEDALAGRLSTAPRMRLSVRAQRRTGEEVLHALALNDAVLTRGDLSRPIVLEARADGVPVTRYYGDGLIVATPTGSTAYALSAGGPILMPGSGVFALVPICAHTLTQRPLVLSQRSALEITVREGDGAAQLTVDGQVGAKLEEGGRVQVRADAPPAHFVVAPARSRFEVLRTKLGWGAK